MRSSSRRPILFLILSMIALAACQRQPPDPKPVTPPSPLSSITLNGAGASFPGPLYQRWFEDYAKVDPSVLINFQSVGSGAGIEQFVNNTVDFGASDIAMTDAEIAKVKAGVVLLPMTSGSIVISYNVPGIPTGLKLSRQVYTDIFLGKIKQWNDARIRSLNPTLKLPNLPILVLHRSDSSGTTAVFTQHLSAISPTWKTQVGKGLSVSWPVGAGVKGNEGMSAQVQLAEGVIAYVEYAYAKGLDLAMASLENKAGQYIQPSPETGEATLATIQMPDDLRAVITDPPAPNAYPLVTYTWILAYRTYADPAKSKALKSALRWALNDGQKLSLELGYLPLPKSVVTRTQTALDSIKP